MRNQPTGQVHPALKGYAWRTWTSPLRRTDYARRTAASLPCMGCHSPLGAVRSWAFWGPMAPARPPPSRCSPGCCDPPPAGPPSWATTFSATRWPLKSCFGYVPDTPNLYGKLRGWEFLRFMGRLYRVPPDVAERRASEFLRLFELTDAAEDLADSYSHGMQQKLALAGALVHDPQVLFLDEPTVGLDPRSARVIKDLLVQLRDRGTTVFLSTHILEIAERLCDRLAIIDRGQIIAAGTMSELRAQAASGSAEGTGSNGTDGTPGGGSLEDVFLRLTGGAEEAELAAVLR